MLSFKGKKRDKPQKQLMIEGNKKPVQVLAVWGSPGSGKTTVAVKLAKCLAEKKQNVLLIISDMTVPMIPCICPLEDLENTWSLGNILAAPHVTQALIEENCITHKKIKYLAFLGMLNGENEYTYAPYEAEQATELIAGVRKLTDYVIIDCSSYIANDILSAVALMEADAVLQVVNCDLKSISYLASQLPLLQEAKWGVDKHLKVINNIKGHEAINHMEQVLGKVSFMVPAALEVMEQGIAGNLLVDLESKKSRGFEHEIEKVAKEVFEC
ncbi:AAA family ATPase [[Clostridium] symbiosum]|nr:AAA family ATPase [[Clostridium] symbiosum]